MRRRLVWIQGAAEPSLKIAGVFRRLSDSRIFLQRSVDSSTTGYNESLFIDTALTASSVTSVSMNSASSWSIWNILDHATDTGTGNSASIAAMISSAIGVPSSSLEFADIRFGANSNWGQIRITLSGSDLRGFQVCFNASEVLAFNSVPNRLEADAEYYILPSVTVPFAQRPSVSGNYNDVSICNPENTFSIYRSGSVKLATAGIGVADLLPGTGVPDVLAWWTSANTALKWMFGDTVYTRPVGGSIQTAAKYQISGGAINFVENLPITFLDSISGYSLLRTTLDPF